MTNVGVIEKENFIIIDGYSKRKTEKSALKELGNEVLKIDELEGNGILNNIDDILEYQNGYTYGDNEFSIEVERISDARFYCICRIVK